jgi:hypothetical protein
MSIEKILQLLSEPRNFFWVEKGGGKRRGEEFFCSPLYFSLHLLKKRKNLDFAIDKHLKEGYN